MQLVKTRKYETHGDKIREERELVKIGLGFLQTSFIILLPEGTYPLFPNFCPTFIFSQN